MFQPTLSVRSPAHFHSERDGTFQYDSKVGFSAFAANYIIRGFPPKVKISCQNDGGTFATPRLEFSIAAAVITVERRLCITTFILHVVGIFFQLKPELIHLPLDLFVVSVTYCAVISCCWLTMLTKTSILFFQIVSGTLSTPMCRHFWS